MKILYIHGLNGSLSPEKRAVLECYGDVCAPAIDYEGDAYAIANLTAAFKSKTINVVIGSSMGGFTGYYLSNLLQCPALLFNPALAQRSVLQNIPVMTNKTSVYKQIVLGTKDVVVTPQQTMIFLAETLIDHPQYKLHIHKDLEHRIPMAIFEEEVALFFKSL